MSIKASEAKAMWLEIMVTILTVIEFLNMLRGYACYFQDYLKPDEQEEMTENAKRMFS
jgi:uncharacterized protein YdaL